MNFDIERYNQDAYRQERQHESDERRKRPILTYIGPEAEMGGLMYEMKAPKLVEKTRDLEIQFSQLTKRLSGGTSENNPETKKRFLNAALAHRDGHLAGLRRIQEETGILFLKCLLENAQEKGDQLDPKDLAYQVASLIESAGDNSELRTQLGNHLGNDTFWNDTINNTNAAEGLRIPGLNQDELQTFFPGAEVATLPERTQSKLDRIYNSWQSVVDKTTYNRAMGYMEETQAGYDAEDVIAELEAEI